MLQHQNAKGYTLKFRVLGFGALTGKTLRVRVTRSDGTSFDKLSTPGDVQVIDAAASLVGVLIKEGDLTVTGEYQYQAFDETAGAFVPTDKESFHVDSNLLPPD
jgi:hypothetical protein